MPAKLESSSGIDLDWGLNLPLSNYLTLAPVQQATSSGADTIDPDVPRSKTSQVGSLAIQAKNFDALPAAFDAAKRRLGPNLPPVKPPANFTNIAPKPNGSRLTDLAFQRPLSCAKPSQSRLLLSLLGQKQMHASSDARRVLRNQSKTNRSSQKKCSPYTSKPNGPSKPAISESTRQILRQHLLRRARTRMIITGQIPEDPTKEEIKLINQLALMALLPPIIPRTLSSLDHRRMASDSNSTRPVPPIPSYSRPSDLIPSFGETFNLGQMDLHPSEPAIYQAPASVDLPQPGFSDNRFALDERAIETLMEYLAAGEIAAHNTITITGRPPQRGRFPIVARSGRRRASPPAGKFNSTISVVPAIAALEPSEESLWIQFAANVQSPPDLDMPTNLDQLFAGTMFDPKLA